MEVLFATRYSPLIHRSRGLICVLRRPGDDLLSQVLRHSTIGAVAFDGRVRDGIGSDRYAESHQAGEGHRKKQTGFRIDTYPRMGIE